MKSDILEILQRNWGYDSFRPLQRDIIESILEGHDTLGLMPTGGGKSITFQVPALALGGLTIVVTPLISLMKDQVDNLKRHRIKAVYFHSGMTNKEHALAWEKLTNGKASFLYVSPERLNNERFVNDIKRLPVRLLVVDEAHCISQWGYDFRPSYLNIARLRKVFQSAPLLALTATATPEVADDICRLLEFRDGSKRFCMSFIRDNISYIVRPADTKMTEMLHILHRTSGSAIVYVRSRKRTRDISDWLNDMGISATYYHAGMAREDKEIRQNGWKNGGVRVMVATNAFGMGIDKPDVRLVIHYDIPPSLEEYYQEAGRAGRDGKVSYAVLLTSPIDKGLLRRRITDSFPPRDVIKNIYERVCNNLEIAIGEGYERLKEFDIYHFCSIFKLSEKTVRASLNILAQAGYMEFLEELENSSKVQVLCTREDLYSYRSSSERADSIIKALLRKYPGLFTEKINISENYLSTETGYSHQEVCEALIELSRQKIIQYIPRRRIPAIYLNTSREEIKYLQIGRDIYEQRKIRMTQRVESMIDYAFNSKNCRVRRMLAYFGDKTDKCGKCDVCRDKNKKESGNNHKSDAQLIMDVNKLLYDHPYGLTMPLIEAHLGFHEPRLKNALNYLINEELVSSRCGLFVLESVNPYIN